MSQHDEGAPAPHNEDGPQTSESKKPSRLANPLVRIVLIAVGVLLVIAFAVWFFHYWTRGRFVQSTEDAYLQSDQVSVSTRVSGFVNQVLVADNQAVKAGDLLAKIDEREPRARLEQAEGQVAQGRASIAQAEAQISQQQAQIGAGQAQLAGAKVQAGFADTETSRYGPLASSGAETAEKYDQMRQASAQDHAEVTQRSAEVLAAQRQIATLRAQAMAGQAQVEQAEAQVRQAKVDLDATDLRASIDGRVGDKSVRVGQYAQAGTRMMSVVPVQALYVIANFKETQIGLMRIGQPVTVKVDALPKDPLHGVVDSFSPGTGAQFAIIPPSNATGNFTKIVQRIPVRIRIDAGPEARKILTPGMSVSVKVDTLGAKYDAKEVKAEDRRTEDQRRSEDRQALTQDRRDHSQGPGR